jgi:hypothetical protein
LMGSSGATEPQRNAIAYEPAYAGVRRGLRKQQICVAASGRVAHAHGDGRLHSQRSATTLVSGFGRIIRVRLHRCSSARELWVRSASRTALRAQGPVGAPEAKRHEPDVPAPQVDGTRHPDHSSGCAPRACASVTAPGAAYGSRGEHRVGRHAPAPAPSARRRRGAGPVLGFSARDEPVGVHPNVALQQTGAVRSRWVVRLAGRSHIRAVSRLAEATARS